MAFKLRSSGLPFKEMGSSPAKQDGEIFTGERTGKKRTTKKEFEKKTKVKAIPWDNRGRKCREAPRATAKDKDSGKAKQERWADMEDDPESDSESVATAGGPEQAEAKKQKAERKAERCKVRAAKRSRFGASIGKVNSKFG